MDTPTAIRTKTNLGDRDLGDRNQNWDQTTGANTTTTHTCASNLESVPDADLESDPDYNAHTTMSNSYAQYWRRVASCGLNAENVWYNCASAHPSISFHFIETHLYNAWDWTAISGRLDLTPDFLITHLEMDWEWDWTVLSCHPNISLAFIEMHCTLPWDFYGGVSLHPHLTQLFIDTHACTPWEWDLSNIKLTANDITARVGGAETTTIVDCSDMEDCMDGVNDDVDDDIDECDDMNTKNIFANRPQLTLAYVFARPKYPWDWRRICKHQKIAVDYVERLSSTTTHKYVYWDALSANPFLYTDLIRQYIGRSWDWEVLSSNPCITREFICTFATKAWDWSCIIKSDHLRPHPIIMGLQTMPTPR